MDKEITLGERINKYRVSRGLSQLELSELLEVSRQSISKWETDVAVPELAKLVKMAEIFGISLDELVLGKEPEKIDEPVEEKEEVKEEAPAAKAKEFSRIKHGMGFMFLGVGILLCFLILLLSGEIVASLVCFLPFGVSAFFCLKQFRHAVLWCAETWYVFVVAYFNYGSGINWHPPILALIYSVEMNPISVLLSFIFFFLLLGFICLTVFVYRKVEISLSRKNRIALAVAAALMYPLNCIAGWIFSCIRINLPFNSDTYIYHHLLSACYFLIDFAFVAAFTACLVPTFYWVIRKKKNK